MSENLVLTRDQIIEMLEEGRVDSELYKGSVRSLEDRFEAVGKKEAWDWVNGPAIGPPSSEVTNEGSVKELTDEGLLLIINDWQKSNPSGDRMPPFLTLEQMERYQKIRANSGGQ